MDISTKIAEQLADKTRAEKRKARAGKTRIGNLARVAKGLGGILGKHQK